MDNDSLEKDVNAWYRIGETKRSILLIGYSNSGRSTFAELLNKYEFGAKNEGLIFEKDKYIYEGIISAKSIKIQTVVPQVYLSPTPQEDSLAIIDVPCYCMPPQPKKWTPFEQKLTINMTLSKCKKVGILLFIEQKNTRSNPNNWKKAFLGFLDMFKEFPEDLINSVGWIITKCPPDMTEDAVAKRIQQLQASFKNQKNVDGILIDKIFESILSNNRFFLFKKTSGNEQQQGTDLRNTYKKLTSLCNYSNPSWLDYQLKSHIKDTSWTKDQQLLFKAYVDKQDSLCSKVIEFIDSSLNSLPKVLKMSPEELKQFKSSFLPALQSENQLSEKILKLFGKNLEKSVGSLIHWFKSILLEVNSNQTKDIFLGKYLQLYLGTFPLLTQEDCGYFQNIEEALAFSEYTQVGSFQKSQNLLSGLVAKNKISFVQSLAVLVEDNDNEAFYQSVIELIESDKQLEQKCSSFLKQCREDSLKFKNPKKVIEKCLEILEKGPKEKHFEACIKIAAALQKQNHLKAAFFIYKTINSPGNILRCMQLITPLTEEQALEYIDNYQNLFLFETAKKSCYEFSCSSGLKNRVVFGNKLKEVMEKEKTYYQSYTYTNPLLQQQTELKKRTLDLIKLEVVQILEKIPNN